MKEERKEFAQDVAKEVIRDNARVEIPIYKRFKGKSLHGSKTWHLTNKDRKTFNLVIAIFIALVFLGLALPFFGLPFWVTFIGFFVVIILAVGIPWIYIIKLIRKQNKNDPMEIHYYDVDYKNNRLTGERYDQTREITEEEFYGKTQEPSEYSYSPLPPSDENPFEV